MVPNNFIFLKLAVMIFFKFIYLLLKDNCFTKFCCFVSNLNMNQPQVYKYPSLLNLPPSPSTSHPSRLIQSLCLSFWAIQHIPIGYLFYIWHCKFPCYSFHTYHPLIFKIVSGEILFIYVPIYHGYPLSGWVS